MALRAAVVWLRVASLSLGGLGLLGDVLAVVDVVNGLTNVVHIPKVFGTPVVDPGTPSCTEKSGLSKPSSCPRFQLAEDSLRAQARVAYDHMYVIGANGQSMKWPRSVDAVIDHGLSDDYSGLLIENKNGMPGLGFLPLLPLVVAR